MIASTLATLALANLVLVCATSKGRRLVRESCMPEKFITIQYIMQKAPDLVRTVAAYPNSRSSAQKFAELASYSVLWQVFITVETVLASIATILLLCIVCGLPLGKHHLSLS